MPVATVVGLDDAIFLATALTAAVDTPSIAAARSSGEVGDVAPSMVEV